METRKETEIRREVAEEKKRLQKEKDETQRNNEKKNKWLKKMKNKNRMKSKGRQIRKINNEENKDRKGIHFLPSKKFTLSLLPTLAGCCLGKHRCLLPHANEARRYTVRGSTELSDAKSCAPHSVGVEQPCAAWQRYQLVSQIPVKCGKTRGTAERRRDTLKIKF